jgi:hypothetical protein
MRTSIIAFLSVLCLALLWAAFSQGRQIAALRAEQNTILAQQSDAPNPAVPNASPQPETPLQATDSSELLRLRNEVNRLTHRKQELAPLQIENQRLRTQLASAETNKVAALPVGYIRKADAQNLGYATPEATLQTFLWAMQKKDATAFLECVTPESAQQIQQDQSHSGRSIARMLEDAAAIPGLRVLKTVPDGPGEINAEVEMMLGMEPQPMHLKQINGQWKLDL